MTSGGAAVAARFPWLRHDAAPILGDPRPRRFDELVRRGGVWTELFRDWLQATRPDLLAGLDHLAERPRRDADARARVSSAYPAFYRAAGQLKDAARRGSGTLARSFPWAPGNPAGLLGAARPADLDELVGGGRDAVWTQVFRRWLEWAQPVPDGAAWLDWIFADAVAAQQWRQVLDAAVGPFAEEIGRLKDALRTGTGPSTGQRGAQAGWQAARPSGPRRAAAAPPQQVDRRPVTALLATLNATTAVSANARNLTGMASWLEDNWNRRGGSFASISATLTAYRELVDQYADGFDAARAAAGAIYTGGDPVAAQDGIRQVRDAVYALAWIVDVAPAAQLGGWPHDSLGHLAEAAAGTGSQQLLAAARAPMLSALSDLGTVYARAVTFLDDARRIVLDVPDGYSGGDSAQPWDVHEVVGAAQQLAAWTALVQGWPEPSGDRTAPLDPADDEAAQQVFRLSGTDLASLR